MKKLLKLFQGLKFNWPASFGGVLALITIGSILLLAISITRAEMPALSTPAPSPTPMPASTPTPSPTSMPTSTPIPSPTSRPAPTLTLSPTPGFANWIMFLSDREVDFFGSPLVFLTTQDGKEVKKAPAELAARMSELWEEYMFSPDRSYKVFVNQDGHLYIYFFQDKTSWPLYRPGTGLAYDPQWSPTGDWIVFVCTEAGHDQIFLIRPDGKERRLLFDPGQGMWAKHPTFSPDGRRVVFWSNIETGRRQLFVINIDGTGLVRIKSDYNDWEPLWLRR